jgi:hypothetical protein
VITRKAYGGAYDVMGSKHLGADVNLAWPSAQIAVVGAQGAVGILYRKELAEAEDPDARRAELIAEYEDTLANPYIAADRGYVDAVIPPSHTRVQVTKALRVLANKRQTLPPKKHGTSRYDTATLRAAPRPGAVPRLARSRSVVRSRGPSGPPLRTTAVVACVTGEPTAEELAALTVVVAALSQRRSRKRLTPVGAWASYADGHRRPLHAGQGGWRAAGRFG